MKKSRYIEEQIINALNQALAGTPEVEVNAGDRRRKLQEEVTQESADRCEITRNFAPPLPENGRHPCVFSHHRRDGCPDMGQPQSSDYALMIGSAATADAWRAVRD